MVPKTWQYSNLVELRVRTCDRKDRTFSVEILPHFARESILAIVEVGSKLLSHLQRPVCEDHQAFSLMFQACTPQSKQRPRRYGYVRHAWPQRASHSRCQETERLSLTTELLSSR